MRTVLCLSHVHGIMACDAHASWATRDVGCFLDRKFFVRVGDFLSAFPRLSELPIQVPRSDGSTSCGRIRLTCPDGSPYVFLQKVNGQWFVPVEWHDQGKDMPLKDLAVSGVEMREILESLSGGFYKWLENRDVQHDAGCTDLYGARVLVGPGGSKIAELRKALSCAASRQQACALWEDTAIIWHDMCRGFMYTGPPHDEIGVKLLNNHIVPLQHLQCTLGGACTTDRSFTVRTWSTYNTARLAYENTWHPPLVCWVDRLGVVRPPNATTASELDERFGPDF